MPPHMAHVQSQPDLDGLAGGIESGEPGIQRGAQLGKAYTVDCTWLIAFRINLGEM